MRRIETDVELTRGCARAVRETLPEGSGGLTFRTRVKNGGNPFDLTGYACVCHVQKADGSAGAQVAGEAGNGFAQATLPAAAFDMRGEVRLVLRVYKQPTGERAALAVLTARVE